MGGQRHTEIALIAQDTAQYELDFRSGRSQLPELLRRLKRRLEKCTLHRVMWIVTLTASARSCWMWWPVPML